MKTASWSFFLRILMISLITSILIASLFTFSDQKNFKEIASTVYNEFTITSGNYTGLWNSRATNSSFTDLPISASINEVAPGQFEGGFFISNNFTSCCNSGDNDGVISFAIDNNTITNFKYDDIITDCNGLFTGSGNVLSNNSIKIDIVGTDCDGNHKGTITLSK